jgi:hypothetical protein
MNLQHWKEVADLATGVLTAYLSARTVYIWYRYLYRRSTARTPGSLLANLKKLIDENPPPAFPSADLPIATIALCISSAAAVTLYVTIKATT